MSPIEAWWPILVVVAIPAAAAIEALMRPTLREWRERGEIDE